MLILTLLFGSSAWSDEPPDVAVATVAKQLLAAIDTRRDELYRDPIALQTMIDGILLPRFDIELAAQLSLGKFWREATSSERRRFTDALYHSLSRTYGTVLLEFRITEHEVLPIDADPSAERVLVRTKISLDDGRVVPVDYRMRSVGGDWKVYDVIVEGISYVTNFRKTIASELARDDLETVIARLYDDQSPSNAGAPGRGGAVPLDPTGVL